MPFDGNNISSESFKLAPTAPVLTADKNYRIVRDEDSVSRKPSLMIGFVIKLRFSKVYFFTININPSS